MSTLGWISGAAGAVGMGGGSPDEIRSVTWDGDAGSATGRIHYPAGRAKRAVAARRAANWDCRFFDTKEEEPTSRDPSVVSLPQDDYLKVEIRHPEPPKTIVPMVVQHYGDAKRRRGGEGSREGTRP
jgi:hypothetical protein